MKKNLLKNARKSARVAQWQRISLVMKRSPVQTRARANLLHFLTGTFRALYGRLHDHGIILISLKTFPHQTTLSLKPAAPELCHNTMQRMKDNK